MLFFCKQKTAYEVRISDWSSDVCSSDLVEPRAGASCKRLPVAQRRGCGQVAVAAKEAEAVAVVRCLASAQVDERHAFAKLRAPRVGGQQCTCVAVERGGGERCRTRAVRTQRPLRSRRDRPPARSEKRRGGDEWGRKWTAAWV